MILTNSLRFVDNQSDVPSLECEEFFDIMQEKVHSNLESLITNTN